MKTPFQLVIDFHNKFGLSYTGSPINLPPEEQRFRLTCLHEELREYEEAVETGDMAEQFDALIDLIYFALGTAHRSGFSFDEGFDRVHAANMLKEVCTDNQRRDFHLEVTKPEGWRSPNLSDLVLPKPEDLKGKFTGLVTIDGVDGSGKTTLAKRMVELFGGEYIHLTWSPTLEENMDDYRTGALMYASALAKDRLVVLERPWFSHIAYGHVYRKGEIQNYKDWKLIAEFEQKLGIIALPSNISKWVGGYDELVDTREEMYAHEDNSKMTLIYHIFDHWLRRIKHPLYELPLRDNDSYVQYDMHSTPESEMDDWIIKTLLANN